MTKTYFKTSIYLLLAVFLASCQQTLFGVDETTWTTLSEAEREKVIDGYNKRKEAELAHAQKQREKELENERHRLEIEAQTAPIYAAADAVSLIWGNPAKESRSLRSSSNRIQSISSQQGQQFLQIGDEQFEVSFCSEMSDAWIKGQKVELKKDEESLFYPVRIRNLDNGESVLARKYSER